MLRIEGLTKRFGDKAAVNSISLTIPKGEMVGVIGRSGAGKSTLLRMLNRLAEPSDGRIICEERDVTSLKGAALRAWRRDTAMIFQQFNLVGRLDVLTNVLLGRLNHRSAMLTLVKNFSEDDKIRAIAALERLDMGHLLAQRAETLSGGQQQRVAIARALVQEPRIILADEPIASLDPRNTQVVMDALFRINREDGITVICNLHDLDIAAKYCDRLIGMAGGKIVFDDAPQALTREVAAELYGIEAKDAGAEALDALDAIAISEAKRANTAKQNVA
jgi:phosphonate transport system ATP-binding protein